MPAPLKGMIRKRKGGPGYEARVRYKDGKRPWIPLPQGLSESQAQASARALQRAAKGMDSPPSRRPARKVEKKQAGESMRAYAKRWLASREDRGFTSVADDRSRLTHHVLDVVLADGSKLGDRGIASVDASDLEDLRDDLDRKIALKSLAWKTAQNVWMVSTRMFGDARSSKLRDLRVRSDNPIAGIEPPERGEKLSKQYLYPSEFLRFASTATIPLRWRRWVTLSIYLLLRSGELEQLEWADIDLEHGVVDVTKATDATRKVGSTKSSRSRRIPIEPTLEPLLLAMRAEAGGEKASGKIVAMRHRNGRAEAFREFLAKAGVDRRTLIKPTRTTAAITFHDLRATGVTWAAVRGDDPLKIRDRAGHSDFKTTELYVREAEHLRKGFGEPFPELPAALLGPETVSSTGRFIGHTIGPKDELV